MQTRQKERIRSMKRRRFHQFWNEYGNYVIAGCVLAAGVTVAIIIAAAITIKGSQKTEAAGVENTMEVTLPPVESSSASEDYQSESDYQSMIYSYDWDAEEAQMLLKIAMAEAEGESTEGKAMVMLVVLNRVWSDGFPNGIEEVIFQDTPCQQFTVMAASGRYWTTEPDADCVAALELIESGWDKSDGAVYFESCKNNTSWHSRNLQFLFQLGNHKFYKEVAESDAG